MVAVARADFPLAQNREEYSRNCCPQAWTFGRDELLLMIGMVPQTNDQGPWISDHLVATRSSLVTGYDRLLRRKEALEILANVRSTANCSSKQRRIEGVQHRDLGGLRPVCKGRIQH